MENRVIRKIQQCEQDFSIVVDYLTTLPYVDAGRAMYFVFVVEVDMLLMPQ